MPRWENNPADVALDVIYPATEDAELKISEIKTYAGNVNTEDGSQAFGIQVVLEFITPEDLKDKKLRTSFNYGSEWGPKFAKAFQMAATGFARKDEAAFNDAAQSQDWTFDTDNDEVGQSWNDIIGQVIGADLDIKNDKQGIPRQQINWHPV